VTLPIIVHAKPPPRNRRPKAKPTRIVGNLALGTAAPDAPAPLPAIVTARNPRRHWHPPVPDLTPEELKRRADAADELWREIVRRANADP
jgi:hypothetical protein